MWPFSFADKVLSPADSPPPWTSPRRALRLTWRLPNKRSVSQGPSKVIALLQPPPLPSRSAHEPCLPAARACRPCRPRWTRNSCESFFTRESLKGQGTRYSILLCAQQRNADKGGKPVLFSLGFEILGRLELSSPPVLVQGHPAVFSAMMRGTIGN